MRGCSAVALLSLNNQPQQDILKMPWEGGNSSSGTRLSAFGGEDFGYYAKDDAKERLHFLFAQIEKEFDALYMENLNRKPPKHAMN